MIWAILAILGVPLWLIAGALAAIFYNRSQVKKTPDIFPAKLRTVSGTVNGVGDKWGRTSVYALWVHDVLLVHSGLPLAKTTPVSVSDLDEGMIDADPAEVKGLGDRPVIHTISLDSGAVIEMATQHKIHELGRGPFAAEQP